MTELNYLQSGEYLIPDLTSAEQTAQSLGKYGMMRRSYLMEHRPVLFNRLILSGKLYEHLTEIEQAAQRRLDQIMTELKVKNEVTEDLKASDPMRWVGLMNSLKAQAEEIIQSELVYN